MIIPMQNLPRGIRNCNPLNIERNATKWQGMSEDQSSDQRFIVFKDARYGIRAGCILLRTYYSIHNLDTVEKIINRFAPKNENNSKAYVKAVSDRIGVSINQYINVADREIMLKLVKAIIEHENGFMPYDDTVINEAMIMAGIGENNV